jgi:hypothetical protein
VYGVRIEGFACGGQRGYVVVRLVGARSEVEFNKKAI